MRVITLFIGVNDLRHQDPARGRHKGCSKQKWHRFRADKAGVRGKDRTRDTCHAYAHQREQARWW